MKGSLFSAIHLVRVPIRYPSRALDFYEKILGLSVLKNNSIDNGAWIELVVPNSPTRLVLQYSAEDIFKPKDTGICFWSENIQATYTELNELGVCFKEPPTMQPWGGFLARFIDLDGNEYQIIGV